MQPGLLILPLTVITLCVADVKPHLVSLPEEVPYFTAAVFEIAKLGNWTADAPADIVAENLDMYRRATEEAKSKGADIIAFPEYGLFPFVDKREGMKVYLETIPDPKTARWNPCNQNIEFKDRPILRALSCMARDNAIVVVADIGDIQPCTKEQHEKCPDDGAWHFNANVAFDRDGTLLAVYRKEHLFFEKGMDLPVEPQDPVFHTDFGTFAMFICFDAAFKHMALAGRNSSIDAVILTTMWIDWRPTMTSVQYWQSWATGNNAAFIACNAQIAGYGATGSGMFAGKMGALKYTFNVDGLSKLVVSRIPKNKNFNIPFFNSDSSITVINTNGTEPYEVSEDEEAEHIPDVCDWNVLGTVPPPRLFEDYRCIQENMTKYTFVKLTNDKNTVEACNNGLCCSVSYSADSMNETFYLIVFNGTFNSLNRYHWCEEKCYVARCDAFNGSDCGTYPAKSSTVFHKMEIKSNFTTDFVYPSVMKSGYRLAEVDEWKYNLEGSNGVYSGAVAYESSSTKPILVAGMTARCYDRDPPYIR